MGTNELQERIDELIDSMSSTRTGQKHLAVANLILNGAAQGEAWMKVYRSPDVNQAAAACSRMLRNGKSQAALYMQLAQQLASASAAEKLKINQEMVLENIWTTVERCMQAQPVMDQSGNPVLINGGDGNIAAKFEFQAAAALRGLELAGKELGMFQGGSGQEGQDPLRDVLDRVAASNASRKSPLPSGL